ncbi:helix-turn-helix domain-containing protein [Stenotrophomonas maltophilia group sp. CASM56]|uniref:helix-turn-helix domain-containing protein n=2 Tax=unclassified Stenotrophomonas maltophilia group TaxID=2961925 RepID=UPI003BF91D17
MGFTGGKIDSSLTLVATLQKANVMNVGQAIRLCRTQRGVSQSAIATRASCSVSYLSMLENNKRDPTLSTIAKIAEALHVPVGLLFVLAADQDELGDIDEHLADQLMQSALASLGTSANTTAQVGGRYG